MSTHSIKKQLRGLRAVTPSPAWQAARRDVLLKQIQSQMGTSEVPQEGAWVRISGAFTTFRVGFDGLMTTMAARSATVAVLLVAVFLGSSGYLVAAADRSLPGERLYSVKTGIEDARLALARAPKDKVKLQVEFAARRLEELNSLASIENSDERIAAVVSRFETSVASASSAVSQLAKEGEDRVAVAKLVDDRITEYQHSLQVTAEAADKKEFTARVDKALALVNRAGTEALKVIVETPEASKDDVAKKLDDKIKLAEETLKKADEKLAGGAKGAITDKAKSQSSDAKENLAVAKRKVVEGDYKAAIKILANIEDMVSSVSDSAEAAEEASTEIPGEVKGETNEGEPQETTETPAAEVLKQ